MYLCYKYWYDYFSYFTRTRINDGLADMIFHSLLFDDIFVTIIFEL